MRLTPVCAVLVSTLLAASAWAQSSVPDVEGEFVELSPFSVSMEEDRGYLNAAPGQAPARPEAPVTLIKPADAIVMEFALSNTAAKQETRNKELSDSVEALAKAIGKVPGLRLEHREVRLASGNRKLSSMIRGGTTTSFAQIVIFADLDADRRLYDRTKQIRATIDDVKLRGETKLIDGPVGLFIRRPNEYRKEILAKIFDDVETVKKGLGSEFEVLVSGLNKAVRVRACSERELELWIDYSFTIRSIRELTVTKAE